MLIQLIIILLESLDELEKIVVPRFQDIINKNVEVPTYADHPFGPEQLGVIFFNNQFKKF